VEAETGVCAGRVGAPSNTAKVRKSAATLIAPHFYRIARRCAMNCSRLRTGMQHAGWLCPKSKKLTTDDKKLTTDDTDNTDLHKLNNF
jgi:hypothetical protein